MVSANGPSPTARPLSGRHPLVDAVGLLLPFFGQDMGGEVLVPTPLLSAGVVPWRRVYPETARRAERLQESVVRPELQGVNVQLGPENGRLDHDAIVGRSVPFFVLEH